MRPFTLCLMLPLLLSSTVSRADEIVELTDVYPTAILPFQERGADAAELGTQASDLLFAELVANPNMYLVEREDIGKLFEEKELNLSGLVNPGQAIQIGYLTGAKIIVTGSVIVAGDNLYVVAKVIGTETSRVLGASAKGRVDDDIGILTEQLARDVSKTIAKRGHELVAKPIKQEDRIAKLAKTLRGKKKPTLWIDVTERHIGQATIDPAAETELTLICRELGFDVVDPDTGDKDDADVLLLGEGFSQFAARHGNLISVKARLELKAVDKDSGRVRAIDRHVSVAVDLAEHVAAKTALQEAAMNLAERMIPKFAGKKTRRGYHSPTFSVHPQKDRF